MIRTEEEKIASTPGEEQSISECRIDADVAFTADSPHNVDDVHPNGSAVIFLRQEAK
jgi:hypothetical protein